MDEEVLFDCPSKKNIFNRKPYIEKLTLRTYSCKIDHKLSMEFVVRNGKFCVYWETISDWNLVYIFHIYRVE